MKKKITLLVVLFVGLVSFTNLSGLDDVISSFKMGKPSTAAKYFDNSVEITMPDNSNSYSKSQAALVLKDFFSTNGIVGFDVIHKGENGTSQYCIGTLRSKNRSFRTTIYMKQKFDTQVLQEIRFENR